MAAVGYEGVRLVGFGVCVGGWRGDGKGEDRETARVGSGTDAGEGSEELAEECRADGEGIG